MFKHCDPAGIAFYPRYFEMINDTVEEFFDSVLNYSFHDMHPVNGVPTAQIEATFVAPSRLGDTLEVDLKVTKLGNSSMTLAFDAHCGDERRFLAKSVLVYIDGHGKSLAWPDSIRNAVQIQASGV